MQSYGSDASKLALLCEQCRGRCCRSHYILLSGQERKALSERRDYPKKRIDSPTGCAIEAIDALDKCPFLNDSGCSLHGMARPLVCRLFPLTYTFENGRLKFYLSKKCPRVDEVKNLKVWLAKTKSEGEDELKRTWTGREIRCFGNFLKKSDDELIEL
jgi:Fe-S-cluster containining protein